MRTNNRLGIVFSFLALAVMVTLPALAKAQKAQNRRPVVAIIRAEWCSACQKLEPTLMELKSQYKDRIDFIVLGVTDDEKTAQAAERTRKLGLGKFFEATSRGLLRW
jgi:thiol-disulfide isomerase/thioredoxin